MSEYMKLFERAGDRFKAPELPLESMLRRRDRKRRRQRIGAGAIALIIAAASLGTAFRIFVKSEHHEPARPPVLSWSRVRPYDRALRSSMGGYALMHSVIAWNGGFVAVGDSAAGAGRQHWRAGTVWTSDDGLKWTRTAEGLGIHPQASLSQVMVFGSQLIAVGWDGLQAAVWVSTDARKWIEVYKYRFMGRLLGTDSGMSAVSPGGAGLVAVGWRGEMSFGGGFQSGMVWTSPDGVRWTPIADASLFVGAGHDLMIRRDRINDVTAGGPGLVVVGELDGHGEAWTSPDGLTWSAANPKAFPVRSVIASVANGGPGLVAVGSVNSNAAVWTSSDGLTWTRVADDPSIFGGPGVHRMVAVSAIASGFVAVGGSSVSGSEVPVENNTSGFESAQVWSSADGKVWAKGTSTAFSSLFGTPPGWFVSMNALTATGSVVVAVGSDGSWDDLGAAVWRAPPSFYPTPPLPTATGIATIVGLGGAVLRTLPSVPQDAKELDLSPDGKTVAFVKGGRIGTIGVQDGEVHVIGPGFGGEEHSPTWSPDGSQIAFTVGGENFAPILGLIEVMDASGGHLHDVATGFGAPRWSPDGSRLVYSSGGAIYMVSSQGGQPTLFARGYWPDWSPDGTQIAFVGTRGARAMGNIWIRDIGGGGRARLVATALVPFSPRWSPDGSRIAFIRRCAWIPYGSGLVIVDVATGSQRLLGCGGPAGYTTDGPSWLRTGDALLTTRN